MRPTAWMVIAIVIWGAIMFYGCKTVDCMCPAEERYIVVPFEASWEAVTNGQDMTYTIHKGEIIDNTYSAEEKDELFRALYEIRIKGTSDGM